MLQHVLGYEGKVYIGAAGSNPTTEVKSIVDLRISSEDNEIDFTTRQSAPWRAFTLGFRRLSVEIDFIWNPADTGLMQLFQNYVNRTPFALSAYDQEQGKRVLADFYVMSVEKEERLEDVQKFRANCVSTFIDRIPSWS